MKRMDRMGQMDRKRTPETVEDRNGEYSVSKVGSVVETQKMRRKIPAFQPAVSPLNVCPLTEERHAEKYGNERTDRFEAVCFF